MWQHLNFKLTSKWVNFFCPFCFFYTNIKSLILYHHPSDYGKLLLLGKNFTVSFMLTLSCRCRSNSRILLHKFSFSSMPRWRRSAVCSSSLWVDFRETRRPSTCSIVMLTKIYKNDLQYKFIFHHGRHRKDKKLKKIF